MSNVKLAEYTYKDCWILFNENSKSELPDYEFGSFDSANDFLDINPQLRLEGYRVAEKKIVYDIYF